MKFANIQTGLSLSLSQEINASEADYLSYLNELVVCPYCSSPVFLKAKNSEKVKPHWAHFPFTGENCIAKSKPYLLKFISDTPKQKEFQTQCSAFFKRKIKEILTYSFYQENTDKVNFLDLETVKKVAIQASKRELHKYSIDQWIHKVPSLLKNVSFLTEISELFWEDLLTSPEFVRGAKDRLKTRVNTWDNSFTIKIIEGTLTQKEAILQRSIVMELIKYFSTAEAHDIFIHWLYQNFIQLLYFKQEKDLELFFECYPPEKIVTLYCYYNLFLIDWNTAFKLYKQNKKPEIYVLSCANLRFVVEVINSSLLKKFTPIKIASQKGFGK